MEDEKGLDLSLGLPCGGNSSSHKSKQDSSSDMRPGEGDRGSKLINEFKNFLEGGNQPHPLKVGESFSYNFPIPAADLETKTNSNAEGLWLPSDNRTIEIDEKTSVGEKRKNMFTETNQQRKHEREICHPDMTDKIKVSHISITTDEGSTAENEDVADSEVEGSTSRHIPQNDDPKRFVSTSGASKFQKECRAFGDSSSVETLGQKTFMISSEKEFNVMNISGPYGGSLPAPSATMNMPQSHPVKDSNSSGTPNSSNYPLPNMMRAMATTNVERPGVQPVLAANFPLMYGYTPVQLPMLDRNNSRGIISHQQEVHATYSGRNPVNPDVQNDGRNPTQVISHKSSESTQFDVRVVEPANSYGKQQVGEEGSSTHTEGDLKENNSLHQVKGAPDQPRAESLPSEFPAIRPGIASDLKFGGCGSYPNLPWVSTTGSGPNGRTISGVTYKYSPTKIKIVCACHGLHMSPEEFTRHASEENNSADAGTSGLASISGSNPAASAQS